MIYQPWPGIEICISPLNDSAIELPDGVALALPCQTHTTRVCTVGKADGTFPDTDGLISFSEEIAVGVRTADCQPVLMYAPDIRAVAAVHAGWRGTLGGISLRALDILREHGAMPSSLKVFLGPAICGRCYEVSAELAASFRSAGYAEGIVSERHLDLAALNAESLVARGVRAENIVSLGECTRHHEVGGSHVYPSWRREPGITDRLISAIRLLKQADR